MRPNLATNRVDSTPQSGCAGASVVGRVATVATVSIAPSLQALLSEALATWMPRATVVPMVHEEIVGSVTVDLVIVGPTADGLAALAELRLLRAQGYSNSVLLLTVVEAEFGDADHVELARLGARRCAISDGFAERLASLAAMGCGDATTGANTLAIGLQEEVDETRNLLALAEMARRLPHAMNNPLSALLAEAQLLELEELAPEQREATERIVHLARRVIGLVRELQQAQPRR